jgi:hypothetical protein
LRQGPHSRDIGGNAGTAAVRDAVLDALACAPAQQARATA